MEEADLLEKVAQNSWYTQSVNVKMIKYSVRIFARYLSKGTILELGPAEGIATEMLLKYTSNLTVVDGAKTFCDMIHSKFPSVNVINSLFEKYSPPKAFDNIILGHVLEHVENPQELLCRTKTWLVDGGKIMCAVPNSNSIHRQAAVKMGLLKNQKELNQRDIHHGHRRVYDLEMLKSDFLNAELKIEKLGGYWLKPLSDSQIEETWTDEMINAFMTLGEKYPEIAGEIFVVATK